MASKKEVAEWNGVEEYEVKCATCKRCTLALSTGAFVSLVPYVTADDLIYICSRWGEQKDWNDYCVVWESNKIKEDKE